MLTVELKVNGRLVREFKCWRVKGEAHELCNYRMSDGKTLTHNYDDGIEGLAVKVIKHFKKYPMKDVVSVEDFIKKAIKEAKKDGR